MYRIRTILISILLASGCLVCRGQVLDAASGLLQAPSAEMGPSGTVTAAGLALTNTPAALTGGADLAAKVRFAANAQGLGAVTVSGALTIGPGVTLEVDSTALEARGRFPLISFGSCEGDFASITVNGHGTVVKRAGGYVLDRSSSTVVIIR